MSIYFGGFVYPRIKKLIDALSAQYQIPNNTRASKGNELGIFQSLNQHYSQEDLDNYWKHVTR